MKATLEPTPELYRAPINGVQVPVRIWRGATGGGVPIEAYVLSITPDDAADQERLRAELPPFMRHSREMYDIDTRAESAESADMREKTKLLVARGEIEEILRQHDICAHVVLLGVQRVELMLHLDASWSNLSLVSDENGQGIRMRSKIAEYQGDKDRQRQDLEATAGMVRAIGEMLAMAGLAWLDASEQFDAKTGAEHTPMKFEPKQ
jgi:hypothetical protein